MSKVQNKPPVPAGGNVGPAGGGVVRPLYGIFINDNLNKFRGEVNGNIGTLQSAIKGGQLDSTQSAEATKAMGALNKALKALGPMGPILNLPIPPSGGQAGWGPGTGGGTTAGGGVMRPLYGGFIKDQLQPTRAGIQSTISDIQASITGNKLSGNDLKEAKTALSSLQSALKDLGKINTNW